MKIYSFSGHMYEHCKFEGHSITENAKEYQYMIYFEKHILTKRNKILINRPLSLLRKQYLDKKLK